MQKRKTALIVAIIGIFGLQCAKPALVLQSPHIWKIVSPILEPKGEGFERDRVYNPTVILEEKTIYMIYRAEGEGTGTGVFGLAESKDGINFSRYKNNPILQAEYDYEKGGVEDPRIVKFDNMYYLFYVGMDGKTKTPGNICLATSKDLIQWKKHGEILQPKNDWESSQIKAPAPVPQKINGRYWMYYLGEKEAWKTKMGIAYSKNKIHWSQVLGKPIMTPRKGYFDSKGVEPGTAVLINAGILLIYNGWDETNINKTGWVLFSKKDPTKLIKRCEEPIIHLPNDHVFAEGMVRFEKKWYLYYGAADKWIEGINIDFKKILR